MPDSQTRKKLRSNESGQVILEYILILIVALSVGVILQRFLREQEFAANMTVRPWGRLDGMIQCGVWRADCGIGKTATASHPTAAGRVLTQDPDDF